MPPEDASVPPSEEQITTLVRLLEREFLRADAAMKPDPGRVTARRLNRAEYTNTIRDLLAVDFRADRNFPTDDSGEGFDNLGDVLTVSPVLMEKYLSAAGRIAERAIATGTLPKPIEVEYSLRFKNLRRIDPSNVEATHRFDFDADYELKIGLPGQRAKDAPPVTLGLWVDGKLAHTIPVETKPSGLVYFNPLSEERFRVPIPEGDHTLRLGFIDDPFVKTLAKEDIYKDTVNKWIGAVTVIGPFASAGEKPSRKRILVCDPATGPRCVDRILTTLARRAYRRPVTGAEVAALRQFVELATSDGQTVEQGLALAIQAMLVSPALPVPHRARSLSERSGEDASGFGRGAGLEAQLLPVELDARRGAAVAGRTPAVERAGGPRRAGDADAGRSEGVRDGRQLRRPVAGDSQSRQHQAGSAEVPGVGARAARGDEDGDAPVLRRHPARQPADRRVHRRALHVPQRAPGEPLRHRRGDRTGVPARRPDHQRARWRAQPRQRARRLQLPDPHLGGHSRQVHPAEHPRHSAATAAGGRAAARRGSGRDVGVPAQADGGPPDQRHLRVLSFAHGSARLRARELRRDRQVAHERRRLPDRFERRAARRQEVLEPGRDAA